MKRLLSNNIFRATLILIVGVFLGWLIFSKSGHSEENHKHETGKEVANNVYTCSMHPQIKNDGPGKCPLCGMDLIPLQQSSGGSPNAIHMSKEAIALANVETSVVSRQKSEQETRLFGKVLEDERAVRSQVAHFPARIEKLQVNFTGEYIKKGQVLAVVYSPELITAQQELIEAFKMQESNPEFLLAAREKLKQWNISEKEIENIESTGKVKDRLEIVAEHSGVITSKFVNTGDYVTSGTPLYNVADLSKVWVVFEAYENDLPYITNGNKVDFKLNALPGKSFSGRVAYIDPVLDTESRVAKIRVEMSNKDGLLKPGMFVNGVVKSKIKAHSNSLVVPKTAVLWTGKRSIVFVKEEEIDEAMTFALREIELGPSLENAYVVISGLEEGEEIVTKGAFNVDAAAQLEGKPSMMSSSTHIHEDEGNAEIKEISFSVGGSCEMCKERIENAAKSVDGVKSAVWDINSKKMKVRFDASKNEEIAIHKAIANAGHDTEKQNAPDSVYSNLPGCCEYRP